MKKISIVSATYNVEKTIERMIKSVIIQENFNDIELIIIDGKSTDNTVNIIERYKYFIDFWISEKDKGVHEAVNKGVEKATGKYVLFLGADDYLYDKKTLKYLEKYMDNDIDMISGKVYLLNENLKLKKIKGKTLSIESILSGAMVPHQGLLMKRKIILKYKFNEDYKIASDYELFLRAILDKYNLIFVDNIIAYYSVSGISSVSRNLLLKEYENILEKYISKECAVKFRRKNNEKFWKKYIKKFMHKFKLNYLLYYIKGWRHI